MARGRGEVSIYRDTLRRLARLPAFQERSLRTLEAALAG